jgi:hypothetical protein
MHQMMTPMMMEMVVKEEMMTIMVTMEKAMKEKWRWRRRQSK